MRQVEYRLSSLSIKYGEYIRTRKKCEPAELVVSFFGIDKVIERLVRKEEEIQLALEVAVY